MVSATGSSNFHDQPRSVTWSIAVVIKAGWHARPSIFVAGIACWARHTGGTARASMRAEPWLIGMVLTDPSATIAMDAFHRLHFRRQISSCPTSFSRQARLPRRRHRSGCRRSPFPWKAGRRVGTDSHPPHSHNVHARWHLSSKEQNVLLAQFDPRGKLHAKVFRNCVAFRLVRAGSQKFKTRRFAAH
jgi:hypothetical protein